MNNAALRVKLAKVRRWLQETADTDESAILSPYDVARLMLEMDGLVESDRGEDAQTISDQLARHRRATGLKRANGELHPLPVRNADEAAMDAAEMDFEEDIDY